MLRLYFDHTPKPVTVSVTTMQGNRKNIQITMKDIAERLSISKVTVSKALRDHPDISSETKMKVIDLARKLGYVPNQIARNLSAKSSRTIGVVVPKIAHHFFSTVIESIYNVAYKNGYEVILTVSQENAENEKKHIETLLSMRVDGLLVSVSEQTVNTEIFEMVKAKGVPFVFFDRKLSGLGFTSVTTDDIQGAELATEFLTGEGYRNIAFIGGYSHTNIGYDRQLGFKNVLERNGLPFSDDMVIQGGFSEEDGLKGFKLLLERGNVPEAVFAITYPVALGVYAAALEQNISIPENMDIICFGGMGYQKFVTPSISYIKQPATELGEKAMELLLTEVRGENVEKVDIKLPTELVHRHPDMGMASS